MALSLMTGLLEYRLQPSEEAGPGELLLAADLQVLVCRGEQLAQHLQELLDLERLGEILVRPAPNPRTLSASAPGRSGKGP